MHVTLSTINDVVSERLNNDLIHLATTFHFSSIQVLQRLVYLAIACHVFNIHVGDLGEPLHTFVPCWMPKPLPPRKRVYL